MKIISISKNQEIYIKSNDDNVNYNVSGKLVVYDYSINSSKEVVINLIAENSEVEYHYSSINRDNNKYKITINHLSSNTISNVYNHIINIDSNNYILEVTSIVPKNSFKCVCNQENQIINLSNGKGTILPILKIDNYDVSSSHSAYIGSFKEDNIYYLMSRGIRKKKCIELLMKSFLINNGCIDNKIVKNFIKDLGDING